LENKVSFKVYRAMIPILEEDGIDMAPVGTLPSTKTFIKMVWGHHGDNMANFKGFSHNDVCCKLMEQKSQCQVASVTIIFIKH
jgi:hypothetical protein